MGASMQPNAPNMSEQPQTMPMTPQVVPNGFAMDRAGPPMADQPQGQAQFATMPLDQLPGQSAPSDDGYRMPDFAQLGRSGGGSTPVSPVKKQMEGAFGGMTDAIAQRQEAARQIADTRAGVGRSMADIRDNANVDDEMYAQRMADEAERHQASIDAVRQRQRDDADFIRTFEPSDRRTTGQRVMGALAVALAGVADGMMAAGGGQPSAVRATLGIIDKSIDRDLDYQREMVNNKRTALAASNTELGQMRERYGDNVDAMKMARVVKLDQYQRAIDSALQQGASAEAVAAGKDTQAQLELQKQQLMYEVYGAQYQAEMRARAGGGLMGQLKVQEQMLKNEKLRGELGEGKPLTAEQKKRQSFLTGTEDSARVLARAVGQGKAAPGMIGRNTPDMLKGSSDIELENATAAMEAILLRDESGASISEQDQAAKRAGWGRDRGDEASRKRALQLMLNEYNARRASTGLDPIKSVDLRPE